MRQPVFHVEYEVVLTWIFPIPESESLVVWTTSEVEYDTQDDEASDGDHLCSTL